MHVSEESIGGESARDVRASTFSTFGAKFFFAIIFLVPVLFLELSTAIIASIALGFFLISCFSIWIARSQNKNPAKIAGEHLLIALVVIVVAYLAGAWIATAFG